MDITTEWLEKEINDTEEEILHRPTNEEFAFYNAVSSGDIEAVRKNCAEGRFTDMDGVGILSCDPLTNLKYHFVITAALVTRFCVEAGMEMEQAFRLSDFYILKLDKLHTAKAVVDMHSHMVLDFTGKMRLLQKNAGTSKAITDCIDYIYSHIKDRITVDTLAEYTGMSPNYLSRLFKDELGTSISDFIREKKIEKAQNLLKYSDYSSIDIANYLSFSSQSHFIQLFKKYVGMTPKKYHQLNYRVSFDNIITGNPGDAQE